jgi:cell division septum initiation protein DivIVA
MFGRFFSTTEVDEFADWIVGEVKRALPTVADKKIKNIEERAAKLNERISRKTDEFKKNTGLNIYKKARLAARVREAMSSHGYPKQFVEAFSYDLISRIQAAPGKKSA